MYITMLFTRRRLAGPGDLSPTLILPLHFSVAPLIVTQIPTLFNFRYGPGGVSLGEIEKERK